MTAVTGEGAGAAAESSAGAGAPTTPDIAEGSGSSDREGTAGMVIAADGSYAACLATDRGGNRYPERWTLDGPEPYAVPLPCAQPEEADTSVVPLRDGRVVIRRRAGERHLLSLLYPSGPTTGEHLLGAVELAGADGRRDAGADGGRDVGADGRTDSGADGRTDSGADGRTDTGAGGRTDTEAGGRLDLVPPAVESLEVYALAPGERSTGVWLVHGGSFGPELVAEVPGRCSGGRWLDRKGGLLALDRELDGRTKAVAVDLRRSGEVSPLLQITEDSNDRLLLADPDSGLLLLRSDAPGDDRLGWGVLGSRLPVRFPDALRAAGVRMTPFALQPGQVLTPEGCGVALRLEGAAGVWVGVWRPSGRGLAHLPAPAGWLTGTGLWTAQGELRLPCSTPAQPCALARAAFPVPEPAPAARPSPPADAAEPAPRGPGGSGRSAAPRPVPLQYAPLATPARV